MLDDASFPHYVYALMYPESMGGRIFYIGKGIGHRIDDHEVEARLKGLKKGHNPHKVNTIRKIWREGEQIGKKKLAFFETHEEAILYEIALIFFLPGLTNATGGGDGLSMYTVTEKHRRHNSEASKEKWKNEEYRRKISEAQKKYRSREDVRQRALEKTAARNMKKAEEARRRRQEHEEKRRECEAQTKVRREARQREREERNRKKVEADRLRITELNKSRSHKGMKMPPRTEEYRQGLKERTKKNWEDKERNEARKQKLIERNRKGAGKSLSEETRRRMSESHKKRGLSEEHKRKLLEANQKRWGKFNGQSAD